jgi:hypothetical protein
MKLGLNIKIMSFWDVTPCSLVDRRKWEGVMEYDFVFLLNIFIKEVTENISV